MPDNTERSKRIFDWYFLKFYILVWVFLFAFSFLNIIESISIVTLIGVATIFITIYIPLAILVMNAKTDHSFAWDKQVILNTVFDVQRLAWAIFIIVIPIFVWDIDFTYKWMVAPPHRPLEVDLVKNLMRPGLLITFLIGIRALFYGLAASCRWLNVIEIRGIRSDDGYKRRRRLEYIKDLEGVDKKALWLSVWHIESKEELIDEESILDEFVQYIKTLEEDSPDKKRLLDNFVHHIEKLNLQEPAIYRRVLTLVFYLARLVDMPKQSMVSNRDMAEAIFTKLIQIARSKKDLIIIAKQSTEEYAQLCKNNNEPHSVNPAIFQAVIQREL